MAMSGPCTFVFFFMHSVHEYRALVLVPVLLDGLALFCFGCGTAAESVESAVEARLLRGAGEADMAYDCTD